MPIYDYRCRACGVRTAVIRPLSESDVGPASEAEDPPCPGTGGDHDWEKEIGAPNVKRGPNWGGGKGNW